MRCKLSIDPLVNIFVMRGCLSQLSCFLCLVLLGRWRNRFSVGLYSLSVHTLTFGLIGFGVCYKCKYFLNLVKSLSLGVVLTYVLTQCLAFLHEIFELGEVVGKTIEEEIEWEYSNMRYVFSGFLTVVVLSLEFMNATHGGFKKTISHLFRSSNGGKREIRWPVAIVCLLKVGLILFCATLFTWVIHPDKLSIA